MNDELKATIEKLGHDPWLAHQALFGHRHHDLTPPFHREIIELWHSALPKILFMAFRGAGKSTLSEEAVVVGACFRRFHNAVILGTSYERACERLEAVKNEFATNPFIEELFGALVGSKWNESKVVLTNGVVLQAFGRGQSLRGSKHLDRRPDCCFADDVEEQEDVDSPLARDKMLKWFMKVVVPALDPKHKIRMAATPLHPESLAMVLAKEKGWVTKVYPIEGVDTYGGRRSLWDARFPLEAIDEIKESFTSLGLTTEYKQEYMCEAEDEADKIFTRDMFRIEPQVRTWHAVQGFYDPARTANKATSASTGWAYFSWIGNRLVVWKAGANFWKPDEMIDHIFAMDREFQVSELGVERDGLEEFVMQPLRHEMLKRQQFIPIVPYKAPVGKISFIKSLQLFFKAREVIFAEHFSELEAQLLGFPSGHIDAPNALAYAPRMRPGALIYEHFGVNNIFAELEDNPRYPLWLALNATQAWTAAALVQSIDGGLNVLADFVREANPAQVLGEVVAAAGLEAGRSYRSVCGPHHFTGHDSVGLSAAASRVPVKLARGGLPLTGQSALQRLMKLQLRGNPAFKVASSARWTLNALASGYAKDILKNGQQSEFVRQGPYRVLIEAIESFAALLRGGINEVDDDRRYAYDSSGRRYLTARG